MLESLQAGLGTWLLPSLSGLLAVAATVVCYRLALALIRRVTESTALTRIFLDAAAVPLGSSLVSWH